jgi:hypothetical protein
MSLSDAYREAACGRVVAMLSSRRDAPEEVARRLAAALEAEPAPPPPASLRIDACLAMLLLGALAALLAQHLMAKGHMKGEGGQEEAGTHSDGRSGRPLSPPPDDAPSPSSPAPSR